MDNLEDISWDPEEFEKDWIECNQKIINKLLADSEIQSIKDEVRSKGHVTEEHKDQFIRKVNDIKNQQIEARYGVPGSETYQRFIKTWTHWQKLRGKDRAKPENMYEENIGHLLYGSTPNPDLFLRDFNIYTDIK
ncbi:MAG TPA: hypothetical protein PKD79_03190 [Candidatus Doudnabacteria bacterium]|nr:hypothetical protein [Candidatus Doudnabacteria bacterium]